MKENPDIKEVHTTVIQHKEKDEKVGVWNGKINFEDQVTRTLYAILKESRKTNRLLSKLVGEDEVIVKEKSILDKAKDLGSDLLDNGKRDHSNVKKTSKKDRK